ncbi:hypothetical protein [Estrella lausannensis]|uniref:Putative inc protein n=1 Tax=Estrella lausannensis TaxID=483423 RepID=A0A0H5DQ56_9BACT|nr:hypothetical protein [Estrella lausannensis]CRX37659.1 Putative inc protein [Estrella lausannensis]
MDAPMRTGGYTQTTTISPLDAQTPKRLVLRLKGMKAEVEQKRLEAQSKVDESVQQLAQSTLGQSMLGQSMLGQSSTLSAMQASFSYINPEIGDENEASEVREEIFKQEDAIEELQDANFEREIIEDGLTIANNVQQEQEQISYFQTALRACTNIAKREGTTLVTALVTGGTAVAATVSAPALLSLLAAVGGGAIVANELKKMVVRELNDVGANEHLQILEGALNSLRARNKAAIDLITKASDKQNEIQNKLSEVEKEIESLETNLETAQGELKEAISKALANHKELRGCLLQQNYDADSAIKGTMKSMETLKQQEGKIRHLMEANYSIKSQQDLDDVIETINQELTDILSMTTTTHGQLVQTLNFMISVSNTQKVIVSLAHDSYQLIGQMQAIQIQLEQAQEKVASIEQKVDEMQVINKAQAEDLEKLQQGRKEDARDIEVAKDALDREKQIEKFGNESMMIGNAISTGGGAALGLAFGGGVGAFMMGAVGAYLSPTAIRGVHYARKFMKANQRMNDQAMAEKLQSDLKAASKQTTGNEVPITIKAAYGPSQGNILQQTAKGLWNMGASASSYFYGAQTANSWLSAYAGSVQCTLANVSFDLSFHKKNDTKYGAVNVEEQQKLSNSLSDALDNGIHPQAVLNLLDGLSTVEINHEVIVMISLSSPAMANLREKCNRMLQGSGK